MRKKKRLKTKSKTKNNTNKENIKKATRKLFHNDATSTASTDESSIDEAAICDDESEYSDEHNVCTICSDVGKNNELWYRCRSYGNWAHSECSGFDEPFCLD